MKLLKAALKYHELGYSVIPCNKEKRSLVKWEPYQTERATIAQLKDWWSHWPESQVALVTGKLSGLTVVDCDSEDAFSSVNEYIPDSAIIPTVRTSKGYHLYFKYTPTAPNRSNIMPQVDIKNNPGYVVAPPSVNKVGSYSWMKGLRITDVELPEMPSSLLDIFISLYNNISSTSINTIIAKTVPATDSNTKVTGSNIVEGERDEAIFSLAWYLVKGGMKPESIRKYCYIVGDTCDPPFPRNEIDEKISSAFTRARKKEKTTTQVVLDWILQQDGNFLATNFQKEQQIATPEEMKTVRALFSRFVKRGVIEKVGKRSGEYRRVDTRIEKIDWRNACDETCDIWLPFGFNDLVEMQPGNIVIVSGYPDAGKTGVLLNVVKNNMHRYEVTYFNSEMGANELRRRLKKFESLDPANRVGLDEWRFESLGYKENYADVIDGGKGKIYIIDYLPILKDFYEVGEKIDNIFRKLNDAVCFIALQQSRKSALPKGGESALELCRLAMTVRFQEVEILKAKNKIVDNSIIGWKKNFKLVDGALIMETSEWQ